jgi:acyl-CoA synthetase (NDP forming)
MVASAAGTAYRRAVEIAFAAPESDILLVIVTTVDPSHSVEILDAIRAAIVTGRAAGGATKTIAMCMVADPHPEPLRAGVEIVPVFAFPENAVRALGKMAAYATWRARPEGIFRTFDDVDTDRCRAICRKALSERGEGWLKTDEIAGILHAIGVHAAASALAHSADEAEALASMIGLPVAAKLASSSISHKTEIGAVRLGLTTPLDVRRAFAEMTAHAHQAVPDVLIDGVLIQSMITDGIETLVGITRDSVFGPLVAFGLGGVNVEVTRDVRFGVVPLTDRDADDLVHEIRGVRLLLGHRGRHAADLEALRALLLRVSRLAEDVDEILELDFNPVMALAPGQGYRVADARIRVAP